MIARLLLSHGGGGMKANRGVRWLMSICLRERQTRKGHTQPGDVRAAIGGWPVR